MKFIVTSIRGEEMNERITKETLIKVVAKETENTIADVKEIYNALEKKIFDILSSVEEDKEVSIKLFEGISLNGEFVPEQEKRNNLTGKVSLVDSHIKPKFAITKSYKDKLNK